MRGKMEKLERAFQKTQEMDSYILQLEGLFDGVSETLPEGFKMLEIDRFNGTENPKNHMRMCIVAFQSRLLSHALMTILFQQTLTEVVLLQYFTLNTHKARNQEEVVKAFITQYKFNQDLDVTIRDLETTRQDFKESFAEFLTHWRNKTAKTV